MAFIEVFPFAVQPMVSFQSADPGGRGDLVKLAQQPFAGAVVGTPMLPSRFDEEFAGVSIPGFGDRALVPRLAGGFLAGDQAEVGTDGRAGEAGPVPDLYGQPERGVSWMPRRHINALITAA